MRSRAAWRCRSLLGAGLLAAMFVGPAAAAAQRVQLRTYPQLQYDLSINGTHADGSALHLIRTQ